MNNTEQRDEVQLHILRYLDQRPEASQREISNELKVSLGSVNYCIRALAEKGCIKLERFRNSRNKVRYFYILTPAGVARRAKLAMHFLDVKIAEFERTKVEIEALRREVGATASE